MPRPPIRASDEAWIEKRKSCWINTRIPVVGCLRYSLTSASALAVLHVIQKRIMVPLTFDHLTGWKNILSRLTLEYGLLEMKQNKIFLRNIQVLHITSECHFKVRYHQKTLPHFDVFQWAFSKYVERCIDIGIHDCFSYMKFRGDRGISQKLHTKLSRWGWFKKNLMHYLQLFSCSLFLSFYSM